VAKALNRQGNAHRRIGGLEEMYKAKVAFEKALTEHRTPDYKSALSEVQKLIKQTEEADYRNPELAEEAKQKGNELFKKGDFGGAVKFYADAVKRNPDDAKLYSNRAACYTKLMSFDLALKDCDKAIELEPQFIKAFLRKAMVHKGKALLPRI
jgi:stress-induced-phosphoprotein 1